MLYEDFVARNKPFSFFCSSASGSSAIIRHYVEEAINGMEAGRLPSNCGENLRGRLRVPQTSCPSANPFLGKPIERAGVRGGGGRGVVVTSNVRGCTQAPSSYLLQLHKSLTSKLQLHSNQGGEDS